MNRPRGDTIIEVLFAVTAFSLVAVGALSLMNRGVAMAQRSLEITQARQQVDAQAEMVRYVHSKARITPEAHYVNIWKSLEYAESPKSLLGARECPAGGRFPDRSFALTATSMGIGVARSYAQPLTYAKVTGDTSYGVSVQLTRVGSGGAYDAYVQACWYSPGVERPMTIGTIVRVYDPAV